MWTERISLGAIGIDYIENDGNPYLSYRFGGGTVVNNKDYFVVSINGTFKDIMKTTGGYVANITTRHIAKNNFDVNKIMFAGIPQKDAEYVMAILYLNGDDIKDITYSFTPKDYSYLKDKFKDCIEKEGEVFDLYENPSYDKLTHQIGKPTPDFGFSIDGKVFSYKDADKSFIVPIKNWPSDIKANFPENTEYLAVKAHQSWVYGVEFKIHFLDGNNRLLFNKYESKDGPRYEPLVSTMTQKEIAFSIAKVPDLTFSDVDYFSQEVIDSMIEDMSAETDCSRE